MKLIMLPAKSPNLNAYAERWASALARSYPPLLARNDPGILI
jgi:hypothetical protein